MGSEEWWVEGSVGESGRGGREGGLSAWGKVVSMWVLHLDRVGWSLGLGRACRRFGFRFGLVEWGPVELKLGRFADTRQLTARWGGSNVLGVDEGGEGCWGLDLLVGLSWGEGG